MLRLLESVFPVRAGERKLTSILFLQSLLAVGAFVAGRSVRDALFLAHGSRAQLAWMYVASAGAVTAVGLLYNPIAARVRRDLMALGSAALFAAAFIALWLVERRGAPWVYAALYVYVEVMGALTLVQFWTLCNELFNAREAKRLYGIIGAGGTLSNVIIGLLTAKIALRYGASALLPMCAALLLGCGVTSFMAGRAGRQRLFARAASGRPSPAARSGGFTRVAQNPHLRSVALLAAVTFFTTTLVDFDFKVISAQSFAKDALAAYFGRFYAVVGVLAVVMQLFGTGRILSRAGVIGALAVLPSSLFLSNGALVLFPGLWAASTAKGADTLFRYSINDATTQILYLPVPPQARAPAKAFIDGVVKPLSIGLGGVLLLGYRQWLGENVASLAWVTLALSALWVVVVLASRSHYIHSLQENLRQRRLGLDTARYKVQDGSTEAVLIRAIESGDVREVLGALELLPHLEAIQMDDRVEALLEHPAPEVRIATLEYYARRQTLRFANSVFRRFDDLDPRVRAAAINAFCTLGRDKAVKSVKAFLGDPDPGIRGAAVTGMIRYGGLDGVLMAAEALKSLIAEPDARMRAHAAKILGAIGVKNFYQPVLELMADPEPEVRRQAVMAAAALKSPEFVIPLIYKAPSAEVGREAIDALAAYGPPVIPTLAKVLGNRLEDPLIRRGAARVLGKLGTQEAVEVIARFLDEPDEELRTRLYRALSRAVRGHQLFALDRRPIDGALQMELSRICRALAAAEVLELGPGPSAGTPREGAAAAAALLSSAITEKVVQTEQRVFLLLSVLYPDAGMERIYAGIRDAQAQDAQRRRANAVELLDNLLERGLKRKLLPLLEDGPRSDKLRAVAGLVEFTRPPRTDTLVLLCQDETAWVRACAVHYAAQVGCQPALEAIVAGVADGNPVVREVALLSCTRLAPERAPALADSRKEDESAFVRQRAELILRGAAA